MGIAASFRYTYRRYRAHWQRQGGNITAISALLMIALVGMLALVIDVGFLAGQRRFMQNGADASALAAARKLAESVSPYGAWVKPKPTFPNFFTVSDATVRATATAIAQQNQNTGLITRTTGFTVQLAYCVAPNVTGYNYNTCPNWVSSPTANGRVPDGTYMVRTTVSSTITTLFGGVVGTNATSTNGTAAAMILGVCPITSATGNIWPFTLWDRQDFGSDYNTLYELWGSTAPSPPFAGSWQNILDLTPARKWCNGNPSGTDPDYKWTYPAMIPNSDQGATVRCSDPTDPLNPAKNFAGTDTSWNRAGYAEDSRPQACFKGSDRNDPDLAIWAATTYQGTLRARVGNTPGNKLPTYQDEQPAQSGNGGQNVATGIYGPGPGTCTSSYFFQGQTAIDPDHPSWGPYRDVLVFTYDNPEYWKTNTNIWSNARSGAPGRVELIRILNFRIYETYDKANSRIWGRVVSQVFPPGTPPGNCGAGPGYGGNIVRLGQ